MVFSNAPLVKLLPLLECRASLSHAEVLWRHTIPLLLLIQIVSPRNLSFSHIIALLKQHVSDERMRFKHYKTLQLGLRALQQDLLDKYRLSAVVVTCKPPTKRAISRSTELHQRLSVKLPKCVAKEDNEEMNYQTLHRVVKLTRKSK